MGDQFLSAGNDIAARDSCPTIWITSPRETEKILEHILNYKLGLGKTRSLSLNISNASSQSKESGEIGSASKVPLPPTPFSPYGRKLRIPQQQANTFNVYGDGDVKATDSRDSNGEM